jgi:hypothetical protein
MRVCGRCPRVPVVPAAFLPDLKSVGRCVQPPVFRWVCSGASTGAADRSESGPLVYLAVWAATRRCRNFRRNLPKSHCVFIGEFK